MLMASVGAADVLDDAQALIGEGDYNGAYRRLESAGSQKPALKQTQRWNEMMGVCEYEKGAYPDARPYFEAARAKGSRDALLYLGRLAFLDYQFDKAQKLYGEYRSQMQRAKATPDKDLTIFEDQLTNARNSLERVEKLAIIDSIAVPADTFFEYYQLPSSAGRLLAPEKMPLESHRSGSVVAFANENEDFMMWAEPDSLGTVRLVESVKLTDGTWQEPTFTPETLNNGGFADYPFMMPDGTTLYYASDGNGSIGGYDIFVASRDAATGEYLQPQSLGMPYNSPYDDFMLAIDEENGIGWWATDRNLLGDKLTLYVFATNELRTNLNPDDGDIIDKARIANWRDTQNPEDEAKYKEMLALIDEIDPDDAARKPDFMFPVGNGSYYHFLSDFPSRSAQLKMSSYLGIVKDLDDTSKKLDSLRRKYHNSPSRQLADEIRKLESSRASQQSRLLKARSEIYKELKTS